MRNIKKARKLCDKTLVQVAEETGLSVSYISDLERSTGKNPSLRVLEKLAKCYDVTLSSLLDDIRADATHTHHREVNMVSEIFRKLEDSVGEHLILHDELVNAIAYKLGKERSAVEQILYRACVAVGGRPHDIAHIVNEWLSTLHDHETVTGAEE